MWANGSIIAINISMNEQSKVALASKSGSSTLQLVRRYLNCIKNGEEREEVGTRKMSCLIGTREKLLITTLPRGKWSFPIKYMLRWRKRAGWWQHWPARATLSSEFNRKRDKIRECTWNMLLFCANELHLLLFIGNIKHTMVSL